jgi:hypothetical protein
MPIAAESFEPDLKQMIELSGNANRVSNALSASSVFGPPLNVEVISRYYDSSAIISRASISRDNKRWEVRISDVRFRGA